jgi:predicted RNA binding protein YcfA (HicA-like mRNA interferase family)
VVQALKPGGPLDRVQRAARGVLRGGRKVPRRYDPDEAIKVLRALGWRHVRTRGSHYRMERPDGTFPTTVDLGHKPLSARDFQSILHQTGIVRGQWDEAAEKYL